MNKDLLKYELESLVYRVSDHLPKKFIKEIITATEILFQSKKAESKLFLLSNPINLLW